MAINLEDLNLEPTISCTDAFPRGVLHGSIQIGTQMFHAEAYQVEPTDAGELVPVIPDYADEIEAVYSLSGSSLSTQTIEGASYVITLFPFAR